MGTADTVIDFKKAFLQSQVRILSAPLEPSRHWRNHASAPAEGELKEKVVQEVLQKCMTMFLDTVITCG